MSTATCSRHQCVCHYCSIKWPSRPSMGLSVVVKRLLGMAHGTFRPLGSCLYPMWSLVLLNGLFDEDWDDSYNGMSCVPRHTPPMCRTVLIAIVPH